MLSDVKRDCRCYCCDSVGCVLLLLATLRPGGHLSGQFYWSANSLLLKCCRNDLLESAPVGPPVNTHNIALAVERGNGHSYLRQCVTTYAKNTQEIIVDKWNGHIGFCNDCSRNLSLLIIFGEQLARY